MNKELVKQQQANLDIAVLDDLDNLKSLLEANSGIGGIGERDFQRIKVPSGGGLAFAIDTLEGTETATKIMGVVVGYSPARSYWKQNIDDGGGSVPPDCYSLDCVRGIGKPGGQCASCAENVFGSATKGKGKACKERTHVYVLMSGAGFLPFCIVAPPTSLKTVRTHFVRLVSRGIDYRTALTEFSLVQEKSEGGQKYSRLELKHHSLIPPDSRPKVLAYAKMIDHLIGGSKFAPAAAAAPSEYANVNPNPAPQQAPPPPAEAGPTGEDPW